MHAPVRACLATVAAVLAATAGAPAPARAVEPGCTLEPTDGTVTRTLGTRTYEVAVPAGLAAARVPLLLSLHGFGSTGRLDEASTGWTPFAAAHGFVVAYPQARPWKRGGGWDPYTASSADVTFLREVVRDISARWCIDPARVHVDGWSNGAVMSQRMACAAADVVASVTSYGGGTPTLAGFLAAPCAPSRPISVGLLAGRYDFTYLGLAQNAAEWRAVNGCAAAPVRTADAYGTTETYACAAATAVLARAVAGTSHNWPAGAKGEDQRRRMWSFLMANPRP